MFELYKDLDHVAAKPMDVVSVFTSINRPRMATGTGGTEPAQGYVCTLVQNDRAFAHVILSLIQSRRVMVYSSDPNGAPPEEKQAMQDEALRFAEEMGFMMETVHYDEKSPRERVALFEELSFFHPPAVETTIEVVAVDDDGAAVRSKFIGIDR